MSDDVLKDDSDKIGEWLKKAGAEARESMMIDLLSELLRAVETVFGELTDLRRQVEALRSSQTNLGGLSGHKIGGGYPPYSGNDVHWNFTVNSSDSTESFVNSLIEKIDEKKQVNG